MEKTLKMLINVDAKRVGINKLNIKTETTFKEFK